MQVFETFDNRELAVAVWLLIFAVWGMANESVRGALKTVFKAAAAKSIVVVAFSVCVYTLFVVLLLKSLEIWNFSQLKPTIVWLVASALVTISTAHKIQNEEHYFSKAAKSNLKLSVVIDFLVNLHVFPFLAEFLLVPFGVLFGGVVAYTEHKPEYASAHKLANIVLAAIGTFAAIYALWQISANFSEFATVETLRSFAIPILLSLFFLPFIFALVVYMAYEVAFIRLRFVVTNRSLHLCGKAALIRYARLDLKALKGWRQTAWKENFQTCSDVRSSVQRIIEEQKHARTPSTPHLLAHAFGIIAQQALRARCRLTWR